MFYGRSKEGLPASEPSFDCKSEASPTVEGVPPLSTLPAIPGGYTGLEDLDDSDIKIPRFKLDHESCSFVHSLTNEQINPLNCVLLCLVKQRILWPPQMGEGQDPLCRSHEARLGHPGDAFPWDASGFSPSDLTAAGTLPCEGCALKNWNTHPTSKKPWCTLQYTFPLLYGEHLTPALLTVQSSAMTNTNSYLSAFAQLKQPLFTASTKIELKAERKGTNRYAVPHFTKGKATPEEYWGEWATRAMSLTEWLHEPRVKRQELTTGSTSQAAPDTRLDEDVAQQQVSEQPAPTAQEPTPIVPETIHPPQADQSTLADSDDLPW